MSEPIDAAQQGAQDPATICPLCGTRNECAMAAGQPAESCWCQGVTFADDALAAIPEASKNKHCICEACGAVKEESTLGG